MSKHSAASPSARHARAKSKCDSLHEPAPCSTTTVASGSAAGRNSANESPSCTPISAGGSTLTVRMAWHDPPPMAALQQLSPVFPIGSRINDQGHLEVGGCDALELAAEFGTPAYVVAEDDLRARARQFKDAFAAHTGDYEVVFASKAFPCTAVMRVFAEEGLGCDVASAGELALALQAGFPGERIHLHGNAKSLDELRAARAAQVRHVVIDNLDEIARLEQVVREDAGAPQPVSIRVTPGVRGDTHDKISTGQTDSKFGLDRRRRRSAAIAAIEGSDQLELEGVHMHIGSQLLALAPFREAVEAIAELPKFREVNLGGGLGVAYTREQEPPRIADYVETKVRRGARGLRRWRSRRRRARPGAGGELDGHALHRAVGQDERLDLRRRRRRHERQPAPDALRRALRGPRRRAARDRRRPVQARGQALRVRRRDRGGCAPARPEGGGRDRHARHRRLRIRDGQHLQRHPARTGRLRLRRGRARGRAPRAPRGAVRPRCLRREASASACSAAARSAARSPSCCPSAPPTSRRSPACAPRSPACCAAARATSTQILRDADLIVEVMGGIEPARDYVLRAMRAGKHVVTANKQLLSQHGEELWACARENGVQLRFEAAVAGVVPVIRVLGESLAGAELDRIHGIVNGTTNYILSEMARTGCSYSDALADAQRLGYAEADPSDDVNGKDAAAKMAIIARLAFDTPVHLDQVVYEGIEHITADDMEYAHELGLGLKLLGHGRARRRRPERPRAPRVPLREPPARQRRRPVQRGHDRIQVDHRDHAERPGRRRPADRERRAGRRHQRDDPAGLDARGDAAA